MVGWLGATPQEDDDGRAAAAPSTEGRTLLQRWGVAGRPLDEWARVVDDAIATLGRREAQSALTGDLGGVNSPARVIVGYRLPALRDRLSAVNSAPVGTSSKKSIISDWCGECDQASRRYEDAQGRWAKCSCHPSAPHSGSAHQARAQETSDEAFLAQLTAMTRQ